MTRLPAGSPATASRLSVTWMVPGATVAATGAAGPTATSPTPTAASDSRPPSACTSAPLTVIFPATSDRSRLWALFNVLPVTVSDPPPAPRNPNAAGGALVSVLPCPRAAAKRPSSPRRR